MLSDRLLDLTILDRLAQLERQAPGLINNQLAHVDGCWPEDLDALKLFYEANNIKEMKSIIHKLKGHRGMIGLRALTDELARMEALLESGHEPKNWASWLQELDSLQQESLVAVRSYLDL